MCFGPSLGDTFVQGGVQVSLLKSSAHDVFSDLLILHHTCILNALFSQAKFKHLNALNKVFIYVLLRPKCPFKLRDTVSHLTLFKSPLSFLCELAPLQVLETCYYLF